MEMEKLNLGNIARGAAEEIFSLELARVLANIADVNSDAEQKRTITLEFIFKPFADRSGTEIIVQSKAKLGAVNAVKGAAFIVRKGGQIAAYPHDPRQAALFSEPDASDRPS
jgi:hypothetical protein